MNNKKQLTADEFQEVIIEKFFSLHALTEEYHNKYGYSKKIHALEDTLFDALKDIYHDYCFKCDSCEEEKLQEEYDTDEKICKKCVKDNQENPFDPYKEYGVSRSDF